MYLLLPWLAACVLNPIELDGKPCPCAPSFKCIDEAGGTGGVCRHHESGGAAGDDENFDNGGGDGDGDGVPAPSGGDGDAPGGDGDIGASSGDGDTPPPPGDGDGLPPVTNDAGVVVAPLTCIQSTCGGCLTVAAMLPCCTRGDVCGCMFPGASCD